MNNMKPIHPDELPERCRLEIKHFFKKPHIEPDSHISANALLYRNPEDYIVLASKEKGSKNYSKWQASFLLKSELDNFKKYHPDYTGKYYIVRAN